MNSIKSGNSLSFKKTAPIAIGILVLIALGFGPVYMPAYYVVLFVSIITYVILSVSWNIFSGPTGYISLATAAFFGVGIYISAFLGDKLPLPVLMLVGGASSFVLALIIGAITLRLRGVYFTIFTFGLVQLLVSFVLWYEVKFNNTRGRTVISVDYATVYLWLFALMIIVLFAAYFIKRSRFGMALNGIGECEDAAAHIGVNATFVKVIAFAVTSFAMGAAGAAKATTMIYIDPPIAFGVFTSFLPVLMVIFGGAGSFLGPVIGALIFTVLQEQLITKWPKWYMIIFGTVMVLAILLLPNGLVGALKGIPGIKKKLGVILMTLVFAAFGFALSLLLEMTGFKMSWVVFALLFGIIGFMISVHLMKYFIRKAKKGVVKNANP